MAAVSAGLGADGAAVTAVHLVRVLAVIAVANVLIVHHKRREESSDRSREDDDLPEPESADIPRWFWVATFAGIAGGLVGLAAPVPAGGVVGTVAGCSAIRLWKAGPIPSGRLSLGVQAISGWVIGLGISDEFLDILIQTGIAVLIIVPVQIALWLVMSRLLSEFFLHDRMSSVLAAAPGGMSEVIATAGAARANTTTVAFTHLVRLSAIILLVPNLILLVLPH